MVYCGKASQGCQNCRTRRIKCDKARPACSQCLRVRKECPGYRDQLSLMFRDESKKVIQKAHAQWGSQDGNGSGPSANSPTLSPTLSSSSSDGVISRSPVSVASSIEDFRVVKCVDPNIDDKGIQFYIAQYLVGHPDEPKTFADLPIDGWISSPGVSDVMAAVGLAGLANLRADPDIETAAKEKYGVALMGAGKTIKNIDPVDDQAATRSVVSLAMFEIVRGNHLSTDTAKTHIMGAAALTKSALKAGKWPTTGIRGLLQLCFSLFIPCYLTGLSLPETFFDWITLSDEEIALEDQPSANLILIISRSVQFMAYLKSHVLLDGRTKAVGVIQQALDLDAELETWEVTDGPRCAFTLEHAVLPREAAFGGQFHSHPDMYTARVWNHYRWARILLNQAIIGFVDDLPLSSSGLITPERRQQSFDIVYRLARDMLISTPTHWRDPRLSRAQRDVIERRSATGKGVGAAAIPSLLFQLMVAASAPGVPKDFRPWVLGIMETIWGVTGMHLARSLADELRSAGAHSEKDTLDGVSWRAKSVDVSSNGSDGVLTPSSDIY